MNKIIANAASSNVSVGTWCVIPSPEVAGILVSTGLDFIIVDMEHGPHSFETAQAMVRAAEAELGSAFIRVPSDDPSSILRALETGCDGVAVPGVKWTDVGKTIQKMLYKTPGRPAGKRGYSPYTRAHAWLPENSHIRAEIANKETLPVILLEDKWSLEALCNEGGYFRRDFIVKPAEPDKVFYIGTYDLAQSMGFAGQPHRKEVLQQLEHAVRAIRDMGQIAGCVTHNRNYSRYLIDIGVNFLVWEADCALLARAAENILTVTDEIMSEVKLCTEV